MNEGTSVTGTLASILVVIGALALFCLLFTVFLLIPLVVFIIAIIALMVSDRKRKPPAKPDQAPAEAEATVAEE